MRPDHLFRPWLQLLVAAWLCLAASAMAAGSSGPLVDAQWLEQQGPTGGVLLVDASPGPMYAAGHIPGAVPADLFAFGVRERPDDQMQQHLRGWGLSTRRHVVLYDQDGMMWAARLYFDLLRLGFPADRLSLLDGGIVKWKAEGRPVTKDASPAPPHGDFRITRRRDELRVALPDFLAATADPVRHAVVEALDPEYYYGGAKFLDRAGHVPHAILLPRSDFFNADQTFKSPEELRRMLVHLGIRPDQQVLSYCGGGVAATVPFFAMKALLGYPDVRVFLGSQIEWLRDDRGLPMWTYARPALLRDAAWVAAWNAPMLRAIGESNLSVLDLRPAADYQLGHLPGSVNVPAEVFRQHLGRPQPLADLLGRAGIDPAHEAVLVSQGGLNPDSALALVMLSQLGQARTSVLLDSVDEWGLRGHAIDKQAPRTQAVAYRAATAIAVPGAGAYPTVYLASGAHPPSRPPAGRVVHLPYGQMLSAEGRPRPAHELWALLQKAGISRLARVIPVADDPGEAAVAYVVLKLMGYPDVTMDRPHP